MPIKGSSVEGFERILSRSPSRPLPKGVRMVTQKPAAPSEGFEPSASRFVGDCTIRRAVRAFFSSVP